MTYPTERDPISQVFSQTFLMERMKLHASQYFSMMPMLTSTMSVQSMAQEIDRYGARSVSWIASVAKGETALESKTCEMDFPFDVFATWWDHLKYDLKQGRVGWLPLWVKSRLHVRYQRIVKQGNITVPVTMIRCCPHVTEDWKNNPQLHFSFIKPMDWERFLKS